MNLKGLEQLKPEDSTGEVMIRATNMANLTTAMLLQFKPEFRELVLTEYGGMNWTNDVLKLAKNYPGGMGVSDAIRFSLALHFMLGIMDKLSDKNTVNAQAYLAFSWVFKETQERRDKGLPIGANVGVAGLGLLQDDLGGLLDWVSSKAKKVGGAISGAAKSAANTVSKVATDVSKAVEKAADAAFDFIGKGAKFFADILCKGFKAMLGDNIGGVLCDIVTFLVNGATAALLSMANAWVQLGKAALNFIKALVQGKLGEAFMALLVGVGQALFSISAPIAVPLFMGKNKSMSEGFKELNSMAEKVTRRNPLFPVVLVMAIVQLVTSPPVPTPGLGIPPTIVNIILALAPMVAVLVSTALKRTVAYFKNEVEEKIADGIEKFIKFSLIIVQGILKLTEIIPKVKGQLQAYLSKKEGPKGPGGLQGVATRVKSVVDAFTRGFNAIESAFKQFNFQQVSTAAVTFLSLVPDVLMALIGDEDAKAIPSLTEWKDAAKAAGQSVDEQEANLKAGAIDLLNSLPIPKQALVIVDQTLAIKNVSEQARIAARIAGNVYKKNQSTFPTFAAEFRAELLKV